MNEKSLCIAFAWLAIASAAHAQAARLQPGLAGIGFLVGEWKSDNGKVADTGGTSAGISRITPEADGAMLLRRDHTDLFDAKGKPAGAFSQIMLIYPQGGTIRADYGDGEGHVIHYTSAAVTPGRSVVFTSTAAPGAPTFRLGYTMLTRGDLAVDFGMTPPGGSEVHPIATGVLKRAR